MPPPPNPRRPAQISAADFQAQAKPSAKATPTNQLTQAIIRLLHFYNFRAWRQNNGGVYDPTRKVFRANSAEKGISDILGYHRPTGRFCAVEVKTGKDALSKEQTSFLQEVERAGGFACEGRDVGQVEAELKAYLLTLPT